ncbi:glucose/arabinose dehydrogenase [Murinocardiopsis flavida]|uniref:Glucose/arabinose dehydrogenase n=1 Tax=Murinocardiopsis flavida TaxID=645275 RepID=A0A2P8DED2_9ACTN|nr:PQQ-dependent sugar dehydrogenase [Murinocardiopsis flavida]PSK95584.1 glucose/arabinose dehydrogenase [Murinocardiopsis flavida]
MKRTAGAAAMVFTLLLAGCADGVSEDRPRRRVDPVRDVAAGPANAGVPVEVADGVDAPGPIAFLPGGDALVGERGSARVLRVPRKGGPSVVGTVAGARPRGGGGVLGLAVSPDFAEDAAVFAYYSGAADDRIVRMTYRQGEGFGPQQVLVDGIPRSSRRPGGRIAFGPDGMLYAGTGDAGARAQDPESLGGKILRMTAKGRPADRNPFGNLVYSYGHRDVEGLAWDAQGRMFGVESGRGTPGELNLIQPGGNYGWPDAEEEGAAEGGASRFLAPLHTWRPGDAMSAGAAAAGGSLWVAAPRGGDLWQVPLTGGERRPIGPPETLFAGAYGRIESVAAAPNGAEVWVGAGRDRILRIPLRR